MKRVPRLLDPAERRVLGSLLEKERLTPDAYPLSLQSLVAACAQTNNREPVLRLTPDEVQAALDRLLADVLVWHVDGARVRKWRHSVDRRWQADEAGKALLTVLLLRGPQTPGELRARGARLHEFRDLGEVTAALARLAEGPEPLVRELPRQPGQKEARWTDLLSEPPEPASAAAPRAPVAAVAATATADGLVRIEERLAALERRLAAIERELGGASEPA